MGVLQKSFRVATRGHSDVLDITPQVARIVAESGVQQGIVNVAGVGSTLGITTLEFEPGCVADLRRALDQIAPADRMPLRRWVPRGAPRRGSLAPDGGRPSGVPPTSSHPPMATTRITRAG